MIDLNLELDYRKEPYQLVRNSKIYILDEKGLENYYSKNHITHKFLSKFHPKIIEHINKMSASPIPQKGDTILVKKHSLNKNLPDIKIEKKLNFSKTNQDFFKSEILNEKRPSLKTSHCKKTKINTLTQNESIFNFKKSEFPKMNDYYRLSNTNHYKGVNQYCENIRSVCLNENLRLLDIFNKFKAPISERKNYKIEVKVNKPKFV